MQELESHGDSKGILFTTHNQEQRNLELVDIALATSAAPTYFPAHMLNLGEKILKCWDGGVV